MKLSIIIPAHNEEKRIRKTLKEYCKFFKERKKEKNIKDFEIIVVLNACKDNTLQVVKKQKKKFKEIKILNFEQGGKGFAIIEGFKEALKRKNDLIGFVDADMSTKPEAFYDLVENIGNYDGIVASRRIKGAQIEKSIKRTIISLGFNTIVNTLFFLGFYDTQCGAKIFKKEAVEGVINKLRATGWIIDIDLLYRLKEGKFDIKEHPTTWEDKEGGSIKLFSTSFEMFCDLLRMRLRSFI